MSSLLERISKVGSIKAEPLSESFLFNKKDSIPTDIPILNVAYSGNFDGGIVSGLTLIAGPSKHFKSMLGLMSVAAYMKKYPDAICLFYDSEFGITPEYLLANGIDATRVLHIPLEHIEQLKFDVVKRLEEIKRGDKVIIFIDSIGNLASKKEVEDASDGKSVADMTRAKSLKSLFRIMTPHLTIKDISCIAINHVYQEQGLFPKAIVSGGTGQIYSASTIWIIGRSQEKDGTSIVGWTFTINVEKSRYTKEKSKLPFMVTYDGGINKWSGLLDLALESGHVVKPKNGWYQKKDDPEVNYRLKETNTEEFWKDILVDQSFRDFVKNKFQLGAGAFVSQEEIEEGDEE